MEVQAGISAAKLRAKIGRILTVLVDEVDAKGATARSMADAPEIDGVVRINDARSLRPGRFAQVRVAGAGTHDLDGVLTRGSGLHRCISCDSI